MWPGMTKGPLWAPLTLAAAALSFQRLWASPSRNGEGNERKDIQKTSGESPCRPRVHQRLFQSHCLSH